MSHDTVEYVLNSGAWSILGLIVGYAIGKLEIRAERKTNDGARQAPEEGKPS